LVVALLISFTIFITYPHGSAQNVLEIIGPADAFEGEDVEFTIILNGSPIQARVVFEDISTVYSNSTTGKVTFIAPSVPYGDKEYIITVNYLGELSTFHTILVKNKTGLLTIELSTDYIIETEEFIVTVKGRDELIMDASVLPATATIAFITPRITSEFFNSDISLGNLNRFFVYKTNFLFISKEFDIFVQCCDGKTTGL